MRPDMPRPAGRPFTGRHMAGILVAFFGVVIAVNLAMATLAIRGFGGTVVENSYVASQRYNGWLRAARAQQALGWSVRTGRDAAGRLVVTVRGRDGRLLAGVATAVLQHPLGAFQDRPLGLRGTGPWTSLQPVPAGRWRLRLTVLVEGRSMTWLVDRP